MNLSEVITEAGLFGKRYDDAIRRTRPENERDLIRSRRKELDAGPDVPVIPTKAAEPTDDLILDDIVWAVSTAKREAKSPYAQAYLDALPLSKEAYGSEGVLVQLLYLLNNLSTWRGENARKAKDIMKRFLKKHKKLR